MYNNCVISNYIIVWQRRVVSNSRWYDGWSTDKWTATGTQANKYGNGKQNHIGAMSWLPPLLDIVEVSLNCYEIVENISEYISMILQKDIKDGWYLRNASNCLSFCHSWIFGIANPEWTIFFNSIGQGVCWKVPKMFCFRLCKSSSWVKQTLNSPARRSRPCCWQPSDSAATICTTGSLLVT